MSMSREGIVERNETLSRNDLQECDESTENTDVQDESPIIESVNEIHFYQFQRRSQNRKKLHSYRELFGLIQARENVLSMVPPGNK